ncbi:MAG: hypothetical protein COV91_00600 [Candidatus Taylorbacteria bacterium CG11_big_fil_rev_8_21_14_0_20_46_11]|uniref:Chorismate mutase domain-containing protein n=1 Tax=Candidatus Taylorbacteria bacterium CG11_big_fil_rev_8_21_14_0_20_46_11 TaxID=1975025 RepID=A0A2H0KFB6_9BACT|nr:MAG: hypothetical protein COV91_00600 [Candidatus Taylorbacteria bacterium CG11_big_fil_rev_8_21_14_0_20_46_11]
MKTGKLNNLREKIDLLDAELLHVLAKRFAHVRDIRTIKKELGLAPLDTTRWQKVLETRLAEAEKLGLSPIFVKKMLELIHERSIEIEGH